LKIETTIRDKLPQFKKIPVRKRPSFHEVRSLGITLYEKQGIDAQALAGHKTRAMTDKYKEGHEPQWTEVEAGLDINLSVTFEASEG
jgi:enterobacteria phage integrase